MYIKLFATILISLSSICGIEAQNNRFGQTVKHDGDDFIRVTTAEQFVNAIGSERNILIAKNTEINLTPYLNNRNNFRTTLRDWCSEGNLNVGNRESIISEKISDGRQLTIANVKMMIIEGESNSSIVVEPRYAFSLNFVNCEQVYIKNLTIGHTIGGNCMGGVIGVQGGWRISISNCDLYGCGTYGLQLSDTRDFSMYKSIIRDCTYGIMTLNNVEFAKFDKCDFMRNFEYTLIDSQNSNITYYQCRFFANNGDSKLFNIDRDFFLSGCEIYHPTENLGDIGKADQSGEKNLFVNNPLDTSIKSRGIGPR